MTASPGQGGQGGTALTDAQRLTSLAAVIAASFGVGMAFGVGYPLTSLSLESWNTAHWVIGLAGAAPALGVLAALPFLPAIVARVGAVRAIAIGCAAGAIGFLALGLFQNVYAWILIRFLMSAGLALPWLAGETWINLVTREETRGRVIAVYAIAFFSGYSAGPLLLDVAGQDGFAPFLAGVIAMLLAGLPIVLAARLAPDLSNMHSAHGLAFAFRLAPVAMASALISGFAEMSYLALIGNVGLAGGLERSDALTLMSVVTLGGVALQFPIGWLADKMSRVALTFGLAAAFIALSLVLPLALAHPPWHLAVAFAIGGILLGFYTVGLAIVGEQVSVADLGAANAAFLVMYQIGAILGPAAAGTAMTFAPVQGFVVAMALAMSLSIVALIVLARRG